MPNLKKGHDKVKFYVPENKRSLFADANVCVRPGEVVEVTINYLGQDDHAAAQVHGKASKRPLPTYNNAFLTVAPCFEGCLYQGRIQIFP